MSNNITIFLKLFLPTFWFVFFTTMLAALFIVDPSSLPLLTSSIFKMAYIGMYILFSLFLYFTVIQLKRVDMGKEKFFVSNYLKTYAYSYQDIEKIDEQNYLLFRVIKIVLKSKGSFGRKMYFIPSYKNYEVFIRENPELFRHLSD